MPSTLRIPLAARAHGDALFPQVAIGDVHARAWLDAIGDDGQDWLDDRPSVYGVLARTRVFRERALDYLARHPAGQVVNLGCGLSHYFQWLDNGRCRMVEGDLEEVVAIRRQLPGGGPDGRRHRLAVLDIGQPGWWDRLGLAPDRQGAPVFLMCEGVLMYLPPATVRGILAEFGARAPAGSVFVFDALSGLASGNARLHASVRHTAAEFSWGPLRIAELTAPHGRLQLEAVHMVMEGYDPLYAVMGHSFRLFMGVPFYALYELHAQHAAGG
ncbi:class I SAM-dependent methyltransferase [Pseudorhodoferax sp.]|uniref:class I SAM-dependent methyltransferase n=1 Tax=Pseudorhodoferax sp. TaxID=1993553 RepID=UPI0039E2C386